MSGFEVVRRRPVAAPPATLRGLVEDFHEWPRWSPWEDIDPAMRRSLTGSQSGVGARYAWSGNRKAGAGQMEIVDARPEGIEIDLQFTKPFKAHNRLHFDYLPQADGGTEVVWRMTGEHSGLMKLLGRFMSMDKMVGPDFDKGLDRLKGVAEGRATR